MLYDLKIFQKVYDFLIWVKAAIFVIAREFSRTTAAISCFIAVDEIAASPRRVRLGSLAMTAAGQL